MKLLEWEKQKRREKKDWKRKKFRTGIVDRKKQSFQRDPNTWKHFVNKPLSNFDLEKWVDDLEIKYFRSIYSRDRLPDQIKKKECGIINLDSIEGQGTHWVCYRNIDKLMVEYFDIHKWIGKLPKPKADWTPSNYKYMGPFNPLDKQLEYDPKTGEVLKWKVMPKNKVDEIAAYHDICYDMEKNKGECDREMVKSLDKIPYGIMPKWGQTARFLINTKQNMGLGVDSKNVNRR